jgi:hypothetical protein
VKRRIGVVGVAMCVVLWASTACSQTLTPEQKLTVTSLKDDLSRVRKEVEQATEDDAKYAGGLIKSLIGVRLEVLKINAALLEQRIHALEGGARENVVVSVSKADVANSCAEAFSVRVNFTIFDKDEFELDSDSEDVLVPANSIGKARGKMLVSPPEKARRMARQGVSLSAR